MKKITLIISFMILLALGLSACAAPLAAEKPVLNSTAPSAEDKMKLDQSATDSTKNNSGFELPEWFSEELTDVNTGMVFRINDFKGKVILVETLAVWCPKCLTQQQEVVKLKALLSGREDFVSIGVDIDPNENESLLSAHVKKYGFDWPFVIASKAVIDDIGALYGAQYLNPPATPMLIIDKQGVQHPLPFGIKSAEELQKALQPFLDSE